MATKTKPAKQPKPTANGQPHVPPGDIMTLDETAAFLRVAAPGLRPMAEKGEIPARFVAGEWRFSKQALLAWLAEPTPPPAEPKKGTPEAILRTAGIHKGHDDMEEFLAIIHANRKGSFEAISRHFGIGKDDDDKEEFQATLRRIREESTHTD